MNRQKRTAEAPIRPEPRRLAVGVAFLRRVVGDPRISVPLALGIVVGGSALGAPRLLASATSTFGGQRPAPLLLAGACVLAGLLATACGWRSVVLSHGESLSLRKACGCYGYGSLANTFLPGRLGEAARVELVARQLSHARRRLFAWGISATIALSQSIALSVVLIAGAALGVLPLWTLGLSLSLPLGLILARAAALRWRRDGKAGRIAATISLSREAWLRLSLWIAASALLRLVAVLSVLNALGVGDPLGDAVVAIGARSVANAVPLAPGGMGVPAAAMAVGLTHAGMGNGTAVAAALSYHVLETGAALLFGIVGSLLLKSPGCRSSSSERGTPERHPGRHRLTTS